jgi:hypothetical protein
MTDLNYHSENIFKNAYIVVSLPAEKFKGYYYKFVAAIYLPLVLNDKYIRAREQLIKFGFSDETIKKLLPR